MATKAALVDVAPLTVEQQVTRLQEHLSQVAAMVAEFGQVLHATLEENDNQKQKVAHLQQTVDQLVVAVQQLGSVVQKLVLRRA